MIRLSILDASPIAEGGTVTSAVSRTVELAQLAERRGFHRYWLTEHHDLPGVASAATALLIAHVASRTSSLRVGSGGIMLANHAPLMVAEQFGTLETLFPGRIDLGVGRASGATRPASRMIHRHPLMLDRFAADLDELIAFLWQRTPHRGVIAVPGHGANVPLWVLGSSDTSAAVAAAVGRPFAFASHFAPDAMVTALETYRSQFRPSEQLSEPYVMVSVNVVLADDAEHARFLATSMQQGVLNLRHEAPTPLPRPVREFDATLSPDDRSALQRTLRCSVIGTPATGRNGLVDLLKETKADELMVSSPIFDQSDCLRSFTLLADALL